MDGLGLSVAISTMLVSVVSRKWSLGISEAGALMVVFNILTSKLETNLSFILTTLRDLSATTDWWSLFLCLSSASLLGGCGWYGVHSGWWRRNVVKRMGYTLNIYVNDHIQTFIDYLERNPTMASIPDAVNHGDPHLLAHSYAQALASSVTSAGHYSPSDFNRRSMTEVHDKAQFVRPQTDVVVQFTDLNFSVSGCYCWRTVKEEISTTSGGNGNKISVPISYVEIWISQASDKLPRPTNYINAIGKWIQEQQTKTKIIYMAKILQDRGDVITQHYQLYDGPIQDMADLEKKYIDTFFQPEKERLWRYIRTIQCEPERILRLGQFPQGGFLLHGPPGTGKSTFAYRVAMTLNRHIVCVDIRTLKNRAQLYQILRNPYVARQQLKPADVVYVFDEFDLVVKELSRRQSVNTNIMTKWMTDVDKFESKFDTVAASDDQRRKNVGAMKLSATGFGGDDDIQLPDLLEAFQGSAPSKGYLSFATTNCFEELKRLCPQLFRVGRLTPVYFGNFHIDILNQVSRFYFSTPAITEDDLKGGGNHQIGAGVCPSQVVEALCESVSVVKPKPPSVKTSEVQVQTPPGPPAVIKVQTSSLVVQEDKTKKEKETKSMTKEDGESEEDRALQFAYFRDRILKFVADAKRRPSERPSEQPSEVSQHTMASSIISVEQKVCNALTIPE
jgi:hypothetical protein